MIKQNLLGFLRTQKQKQLLIRIDINYVFESIYGTIISNIQKISMIGLNY